MIASRVHWSEICIILQQISVVCCCNCWALILKTVCLNTEWAIGIWQSWLQHFNGWWKAVKNLICHSCIFNLQLHVHVKKWTLKFKLLYLRNYISYFNKICSVCCVNTHIQSLKVWLKFVLSWLKYSIFSRGLFFIGAPCIYSGDVSAGPVSRGGEVSIWWMPVCSGCVRAVLCAGTSTCDRNLMRFDCIFRCYIWTSLSSKDHGN